MDVIRFLYAARCLGFPLQAAANAAATCDLSGLGVVAYKDFRKYMEHLDVRPRPASCEGAQPYNKYRVVQMTCMSASPSGMHVL